MFQYFPTFLINYFEQQNSKSKWRKRRHIPLLKIGLGQNVSNCNEDNLGGISYQKVQAEFDSLEPDYPTTPISDRTLIKSFERKVLPPEVMRQDF